MGLFCKGWVWASAATELRASAPTTKVFTNLISLNPAILEYVLPAASFPPSYNAAVDDAAKLARIRIADRVVACLAIFGSVWQTMFIVVTLASVSHEPSTKYLIGDAGPYLLYSGFWLLMELFCCFGLFQGRKWSFVILWLYAMQRGVNIVTYGSPASGYARVTEVFIAILFLYCGFRLFALAGSKIVGLFPARDESLYSD
jgi:hypothetical protein